MVFVVSAGDEKLRGGGLWEPDDDLNMKVSTSIRLMIHRPQQWSRKDHVQPHNQGGNLGRWQSRDDDDDDDVMCTNNDKKSLMKPNEGRPRDG